ncbi:MAG TPA: hypothetical protein VMU29_07615 [Smithella sp.]|nr:hypothetical protein [Smithella sp.]
MTKKNYLRMIMILAVAILALGGWLLHLRIHEITKDTENYIPFVSGIISIIVIPLLFAYRPTLPFAYLINGMTVIIGTITMTHFTLTHPPDVWTLQTVLFGTLLADIILLWGKFAVGKAIYELEPAINNPEALRSKGRFFRFPNMGFWLLHVVTLSVVYTIGKYLWT